VSERSERTMGTAVWANTGAERSEVSV
jgi:hypothetical protein